MIDMFAKVVLSLLLITVVVSYPIPGVEDDDDLPVYTEKVSAAKPTTRVPRFESKKLQTVPKKVPENYQPAKEVSFSVPEQPILNPNVVLKTTKPVRPNVRPVRRTPDHPQNAIVEATYLRQKPALRVGYNAPKPSYAAAPALGVEYAPEVEANNYEEPHLAPAAPVPEERPQRLVKPSISEHRAAVGNAPHLRYEVPPQVVSPPRNGYNADHYEDKPQPYIFGYEFKDENGATQNRKEEGDDYGNKKGSYGYTDEHGIYRQVDYIADSHGFRAIVKTNEPGTDNQNPADVEIHSEAAKH